MVEHPIQSIALIGAGNVGTQLGLHLHRLGFSIPFVMSKNVVSARKLADQIAAEVIEKWDASIKVDLVLLCVSDTAIATVIQDLPSHQRIAYTSGSVLLQQFTTHPFVGVFYPLQTFSTGRNIDFQHVPFLIEATDEDLGKALFSLAQHCSSQVEFASSEARKNIHISAVFVNNFTNHLAYIAQQLMVEKGLNWELLKPLMQETIAKLDQFEPYDAQTGPARRNDLSIIQEHVKMLGENEKKIYQLLTDSLIKTYTQKNDQL